MKLVIDASVAVKWFIREQNAGGDLVGAHSLLRALHRGDHEALQPPHWLAEVLSVIVRLRPRRSDAVIALLSAVSSPAAPTLEIYRRAASLAKQHNAHVFDTLYHAVAIDLGATLVTADEAYFGKGWRDGSIVRLSDLQT